MRRTLLLLCLLVVVGRVIGACSKGTTGKSPNCKDCPAGTTTAKDGDNLPCNLCESNYYGKAPNCKPCKAAGGFSGATTTLNGKCVCAKGTEGTYPTCNFCAAGLDTSKDGNGQKCQCVQVPVDPEFDYYTASYSCSKCDASKGYHKPEVYFWPKSAGVPPGLVCVRCSAASGGVVKAVGGGSKVCSCDIKKGKAVKLALNGPARAGSYCMQCTGAGQRIDSMGRCVCKKGYALSRTYFEDDYCIPCGDGKTNYVDKSGMCQCKPGYAFSSNGNKCLPCAAPGYKIKEDGTCSCKPGWYGSTSYYADFEKPRCDQCAVGMTSIELGGTPQSVCICKDKRAGFADTSRYEKGCKCRWGYTKDAKGACTTNTYCKSGTYVVEFWSGAQLPKTWNGKSFPKAVLSLKPTARKLVKEAAKTAAFTLAAADVPAGVDKAKFVARIRRCSCVFHADQDSSFAAFFKVEGSGAGAVLTIDGGTGPERCEGDYHDQNICMRPGVIPVIPVNFTLTNTHKANTHGKTVTFPVYNPRQGGWLSGFDYIPIMDKYEACHNITLEYWSTGGNGIVSLKVPKETIF